jgi:hypothetical protein
MVVVELILNKQLESEDSGYSQVFFPGGLVTGILKKTP